MSQSLRRRRHGTPTAVDVTPNTPAGVHPTTEQMAAAVTNIHGAAVTAGAEVGLWTSGTLATATIDQTGLATTVAAGTTALDFTTTRGGIGQAGVTEAETYTVS